MKKIFLAIVLGSALVSCKKETTNSKNSSNNTINTSTCVDNPNINFKSIGTPIGKFGDCIKDIEGNTYKTAVIGSQTWMAENLKTSKYNDGTQIPNIKDSIEWSKLTIGAWCIYNNDVTNNAKYGKLYNWYVVSPTTNGNKNVCPTGWHVPSDAEWDVLDNDYLGNDAIAGGKMKEVGNTNWSSPNIEATNTSLFTGLPGGGRSFNGVDYGFIGKYGIWWSSSEHPTNNAGIRILHFGGKDSDESYRNRGGASSIRCLKD
jgi:uncharacterized protein (TIGR02145 family)